MKDELSRSPNGTESIGTRVPSMKLQGEDMTVSTLQGEKLSASETSPDRPASSSLAAAPEARQAEPRKLKAPEAHTQYS